MVDRSPAFRRNQVGQRRVADHLLRLGLGRVVVLEQHHTHGDGLRIGVRDRESGERRVVFNASASAVEALDHGLLVRARRTGFVGPDDLDLDVLDVIPVAAAEPENIDVRGSGWDHEIPPIASERCRHGDAPHGVAARIEWSDRELRSHGSTSAVVDGEYLIDGPRPGDRRVLEAQTVRAARAAGSERERGHQRRRPCDGSTARSRQRQRGHRGIVCGTPAVRALPRSSPLTTRKAREHAPRMGARLVRCGSAHR